MTLSEKMIRYRAKNRLSQREFAKKCGVTVQTICSVENDKQKAGKLTEQKILIAMEDALDESI